MIRRTFAFPYARHARAARRSVWLGAAIIWFLTAACANPMIRKARFTEFQKAYQDRTWKARKDLRAVYFGDQGGLSESPVLFKKGTRLKIWFTTKAGWLKLKAYSANNDREQARGRTIIYIFADDIRESLRAGGSQKTEQDKKGISNKSGKNDKKNSLGAPLVISDAQVEDLALKHMQQKINELLE